MVANSSVRQGEPIPVRAQPSFSFFRGVKPKLGRPLSRMTAVALASGPADRRKSRTGLDVHEVTKLRGLADRPSCGSACAKRKAGTFPFPWSSRAIRDCSRAPAFQIRPAFGLFPPRARTPSRRLATNRAKNATQRRIWPDRVSEERPARRSARRVFAAYLVQGEEEDFRCAQRNSPPFDTAADSTDTHQTEVKSSFTSASAALISAAFGGRRIDYSDDAIESVAEGKIGA